MVESTEETFFFLLVRKRRNRSEAESTMLHESYTKSQLQETGQRHPERPEQEVGSREQGRGDAN